MLHVRTRSAEETKQVAEAIEPVLQSGDVILLSGDLGAGKTVFTQGLAFALGVNERVTSPTFTLAASYEGRIKLHHLDVYRLENLAEVVDLYLPGLLDDDAIVCIEWGEVVMPEIPREFLKLNVQLGHPEDIPDARVLEFEFIGPMRMQREGAIASRCAAWIEKD